MPGQPVTFTTVVTNNGPLVALNVKVTQMVTADSGLATTDVITVSEIISGASASVPHALTVPLNFSDNGTITFTQVVTVATDPSEIANKVITKSVTMPTVRLATASASVNESNDLQLGVELDLINPYADSIFTIQTSNGSAAAGRITRRSTSNLWFRRERSVPLLPFRLWMMWKLRGMRILLST